MESNNENKGIPFNLNYLEFLSNDHLRYESGQLQITEATDSEGHNIGALRKIIIQSNIQSREGFTVTILNMNADHPVWGDNVQMAPKQMRVTMHDGEKVMLKGFGEDIMGGSFSDYGLTIKHDGKNPTKMILHLFDRNTDVEYLESQEHSKPTEIELISNNILSNYSNDNNQQARDLLTNLYYSVKRNPEQLKEVIDYEKFGKTHTIMLSEGLTDDIDVRQMMASIAYLFISKATQVHPENFNLFKDRLYLLSISNEPLSYTVMSALKLNQGSFYSESYQDAPMKARNAIYKMEISDLELNPILYQKIEYFTKRRIEFDEMINNGFFLPNRDKSEIVEEGKANHEAVLKYLEQRVLVDCDIDF